MGDFLGLKPIAVISLDGQFPWPQALSYHRPQQAIPWSVSSPELSLALMGNSLGLKPSAVNGLDGQFP
jgi:hypothetical protein